MITTVEMYNTVGNLQQQSTTLLWFYDLTYLEKNLIKIENINI